ncbi:MAG: glycosyltransferase family 39 protein, partial [Bacteroidetes bacterium]|nr:glycosyltransferase family 39 protein [Bacteroidota bacterium]
MSKKTVSRKNKSTFYIAVIIILTLAAYFSSLGNEILNWDDNIYVSDNPDIKSLTNLPLFFTKGYIGHFQPVTITVYCLIYQIGRLTPCYYHFTGVIFHIINVLLVFFLCRQLTGRQIPALIAALIFGLHPMHVESVAWISGLKDLVFTCFFLLSLLAYIRYFRQNKLKWYIITLVLFLFSLLSKGQAVTLPVVLLLIDYFEGRELINRKALLEKIPFFTLSVVFGLLAVSFA